MQILKFTILLFLFPCTAYSQWSVCYDGEKAITALYFIDTLTGFGVGPAIIVKTVDGGINWKETEFPSDWWLNSVSFPSADTGYVVGYNGGALILKTIDAGETWNVIETNIIYQLYDVVFFNGLNGMATAENNMIFKTSNGFATSQLSLLTSPFYRLTSIFFTSWDTGFVAGFDIPEAGGAIFRTYNHGLTWEPTGFCQTNRDLFFTESSIGISIAGSSISKTMNGGEEWNPLSTGSNFFDLRSVYLVNSDTGLIVGQNDDYHWLVLETNDGGNNWENIEVPDSSGYLMCITCINRKCFAGSNNGSIITNAKLSTPIDNPKQLNYSVSIFPNPSSDLVNIQWYGLLSQTTKILMYNALGEIVWESKAKQGSNSIQIDIGYLPSGIYLIAIVCKDLIMNTKIVKN